jgi:hypothetical protein
MVFLDKDSKNGIILSESSPHTRNVMKNRNAIQKTWFPEGSREYRQFKLVTRENLKLVKILKKHVPLSAGDLVLDVGGRDGNVSFALQKPEWVHVVDPDPKVRLLKRAGKFWHEKIQNVQFEPNTKYKLIVCCHVLGYLNLEGAQKDVLDKLVHMLADDGVLALYYNANDGYMASLLEYSKHVLSAQHFDYFDEELLRPYKAVGYNIKHIDTAFDVSYKTYDALARCCWFLFGAMNPDIAGSAKRFVPKLENELAAPSFIINERVMLIKHHI